MAFSATATVPLPAIISETVVVLPANLGFLREISGFLWEKWGFYGKNGGFMGNLGFFMGKMGFLDWVRFFILQNRSKTPKIHQKHFKTLKNHLKTP
jgi:hypothetical protein